MALHPRPDEVTPTDVHLVITPTARGQDLYAWIALPSTASCGDARRAAREMRRATTGPRLEAACVAEEVLGDPAKRRAYDELRARVAAAGVPLPAIGPAMRATALPPPARERARVWARTNGPKLVAQVDQALTVTGRFTIGLLKVLFVLGLIVLAAVCVAKWSPPKTDKTYDYKVPEYRYTPMPEYRYVPPPMPPMPDFNDYKIPKVEMPKFDFTPQPEPKTKPKKHRKKK